MYYSLLLTNKIYCTCIRLNEKIDEGKIMYIKKFKKPKDLKLLESKYDNEIRAKTLIEFLLKGKKRNIHKEIIDMKVIILLILL